MATIRQHDTAVTGIGIVSSIGTGREQFWNALASGRSGVREASLLDTKALPSRLTAEVAGFAPAEILGPKGLRLLDRTTLLAQCAAALALQDAGLDPGALVPGRTGIALGSAMGSLKSRTDFCRDGFERGPRAINPALFPNTVVNSPASQVAIRFAIRGPNATLCNGWISDLEAIEYAAGMLSSGRASVMLSGGAEEVSEVGYWCLQQAGLLSRATERGPEGSMPFDRRRNGFVYGEGAAVLVLEELSAALERGARIHGLYLGGASGADLESLHGYTRRAGGLEQAIRGALARSGTGADEVGWVASGASSSPLGDLAEGHVLARALPGTPVTAIKAMLGETISASGTMQAAAALLGMQHGVMPPTPGIEQFDERCRVSPVPQQPRPLQARRVLVVNTGPTGQSAAALFASR